MKLFDIIEEDHKLQRDLMQQIENTTVDSDKRLPLFKQFAREFRAHAAAEEHAFYSELMTEEATTDQSRHSVAEHQDAMELLEKLEDLDAGDEQWLTTFKKLSHDNEHHMKEEENEVFAAARKSLTEKELTTMAGLFNERKQAELG